MFRAAFQTTFQPSGVLSGLNRRIKARYADVSALILSDCNRYARDDTGRLIASSYAASNLNVGRLVWSTPYAHRVYLKGVPSHKHNPAASLRWCEKAASLYKKSWTAQTLRLLGGDGL
jgi:hypothetical protein